MISKAGGSSVYSCVKGLPTALEEYVHGLKTSPLIDAMLQ